MMIDKIKRVLDRSIIFVASILLVILVIGALWQVFTRYILQSPSTFTNELLGFLLVWTSLLGATYAFGENKHLALTFMMKKLTKSRKLIITILNDLIIILFAVVILLKGGIDAVQITMMQNTPILGIPKGIVYLIMPISGVLIILYKLLDMKNYRAIIKKECE
ncbi:TRAP transporter small permease [Gracilibacillus sp. S3-1-1]|uniref:TRAP transporter small permease n=1 Tax=Gracilibacillus pellucidus TaxID=3095368 RepID=A0ACC6M0S1_9BACI|nr:TRAP transporter small permease [Gracilibacillus sp. S3-1-1]MDX8044534.1 TRAP transporter small permease [Gracilibacillus sp. S3-1-1]